MSAIFRYSLSLLAVLLLSFPLEGLGQAPDPLATSGQTPDQEWAASISKYFPLRGAQTQSSDETGPQPQIVRLSLVQGDVRVLRGKAIEKQTGDVWEQAVANLPLAAGYTLATGDGRAEIEFEDASTAYLAPNSVLALNVLTSAYGAPQTQLSLLSGTLTANFHPTAPGDVYILQTPTDNLSTSYPVPLTARVDSYLDATAVTRLTLQRMPGQLTSAVAPAGETKVYRRGTVVQNVDLPDATTAAAWDAWVQERVTTRNLRLARVMKAAGLRLPLAGLEDLDGKGTFFPCETVGRCWQPNTAWNGEDLPAEPSSSQPAPPSTAPHLTPASYNPRQQSSLLPAGQSQTNGALGPNQYYVDDDPFPCTPYRTRSLYETDPVTGKSRLIRMSYMLDPVNSYPYNWAVCHAGFWVHEHRRYVWYADRRRHHHLPIRWVKSGGRTGFVPMHPLDERGKPPLNLRHDVFAPRPGDPHTVDLVEFNTDGLKLLDKTPKEFAHTEVVALERASTPQPVASEIAFRNDTAHPNAPSTIHATALAFNDKKQAFQLAHQSLDGSHPTISPQHFNASMSSLQSQPHNTSEGGRISSNTWNSAGARSSSGGGVSMGRSAPASYSGGSSSAASHMSSAPVSSSPAPSSSASSSAASSAHH